MCQAWAWPLTSCVAVATIPTCWQLLVPLFPRRQSRVSGRRGCSRQSGDLNPNLPFYKIVSLATGLGSHSSPETLETPGSWYTLRVQIPLLSLTVCLWKGGLIP